MHLGRKLGLLELGSVGFSLGLGLGLVHGFELGKGPPLSGFSPCKGSWCLGSYIRLLGLGLDLGQV